LEVTACAILTGGSSPIYYTLGADSRGVYRNVKVLWELYGPEEEDYRFLSGENREPHVRDEGAQTIAEMRFRISRPGKYRLRAATVDLAGRTATVWKNISVKN
jgi:hypothetical protein